jgi:hypothetical protein
MPPERKDQPGSLDFDLSVQECTASRPEFTMFPSTVVEAIFAFAKTHKGVGEKATINGNFRRCQQLQ